MQLFKMTNIVLAILCIVPVSIHAKTQFIQQNKVEFMLADFAAQDSISCLGLLIPSARILFTHKIIPLRVAIKNTTEQDILFSASCVAQTDSENLFDICKHSEIGVPAAVVVFGSWLMALCIIGDYTNHLRGHRHTGGRLCVWGAVLTSVYAKWFADQAKQKNKKIKEALAARAHEQEVKIPAGGTYTTIFFIDQVDLWQQPVIRIHNEQGALIASCPLALELSFNFSTDINRYEYQGGLQ